MPVPTETFRSIRKLNLVFAASAAFMLLITAWLIWDDWNKAWRGYQQDARQWQAVLTADTLAQTANDQLLQELAMKEEEIRRLRDALPKDALTLAERDLADLQKNRIKQDLPVARAKSEIVPTEQKIERARLQYGEDAPQTNALRAELKAIKADYETKNQELTRLDESIKKKTAEIAQIRKAEEDQKKDLENLDRERRALADKLAKLNPHGLGAAGEKLRNAPLIDWFNPSEKIEQVIVPGVRTDLNFLTVETADACQSCHINIDKPEFDETELVRFLQRQVARSQNQDVNSIDDAVVDVDFWESAMNQLAATGGDASVRIAFRALQKDALQRINQKRSASEDATLKPLLLEVVGRDPSQEKGIDPATWNDKQIADVQAALTKELQRLAETVGNDKVTRRTWYEQRILYVEDMQNLIKRQVGDKQFAQLRRYFRHHLIDQFNAVRAKQGASAVSASSVMLAHPRLDLYLDAESPHPLKTMGCSVCHEGSGQETNFFHVAHTPRNIWVDADTGATVPAFLVTEVAGNIGDLRSKTREAPKTTPQGKDHLVTAGAMIIGSNASAKPQASTAPAGKEHEGAHGSAEGHGSAVLSQHDVNLLDANDPAPFAPAKQDHQPARIYIDPVTGSQKVAVRQATHWERKYHWHAVHAVDWEKPMHAMEFVQSSCTKCHTGHYDLRNEAPKVFEGRKQFAQLGCANCHQVDGVLEHNDVKKVGPSLVHVKDKMSSSMLSTWIWSPKAFRPTTRMPHFFMLENNSSPVDVLRTRTEVAAITHYLLNAGPASLDKMALLLNEDGKLVAERAKPDTANSRKFEIDKRRTAIAADVDALKKSGIHRYEPELPPTQAKLKSLADEKAKIEAKLKDAATKAEDKPALQARLTAIEGEAKTAKEKPMFGDAARGKELFMGVPGATIADGGVGCVACHTNLNDVGQLWITSDLMKRRGDSKEVAEGTYKALSYNQKHTYVRQYLGDKLNKRAPELSGVGTKLKAGRTDEQAAAWVYDWVRNPKHYSSYTIMPSFRLSEQEALDLTAYLLKQERPGDAEGSTYAPVDFVAEVKGEVNGMMLNSLMRKLGGALDEQAAAQLPVEAKLMYIGRKMVAHYNCQACHLINGFEDTASSAPQLNDWGLKDVHKLDFGYFEHAESNRRKNPSTVWKAAHEGLASDAPHITAFKSAADLTAHAALKPTELAWEEIEEDRRSWLNAKLHNTRVYDRGKYVVPEAVAELDKAKLAEVYGSSVTGPEALKLAMREGIDRAYDKLKMPKFFMTDEDAQAIITFVTSVRKPLVDPSLMVNDPVIKRTNAGRQIAEKYNCYGCHNIEGNRPAVQSYFDVFDDNGNFTGNFERLMNAPPRLIGQGAKTQPDWIPHFLNNVHKLRPWLKVRMPSFHYHDADAMGIAEYFAGATQLDGRKVDKVLAPIEAQIGKNDARKRDLDIEAAKIAERLAASEKEQDGTKKLSFASVKAMTGRLSQIEAQKATLDRWMEQPAVGKSTERLKQFALRNDLSQPRTFDPRKSSPDERAATYQAVLAGARFLQDVYKVDYPYPPLRLPDISEERFARGEALFAQVLCAKCHALGDEDKLLAIWKKDNPNAGAPKPPVKPEDDYDTETPKPKPATPNTTTPKPKPAGGDDDYDEKPATPPAAPPTGPGWSAPNLKYAVHRIQPRYAEKWIQRSLLMLPGTKMPNQWAGPSPHDSFFFQFPEEARIDLHKKFYYTGPEQRQLILDYIYAAGMRNYTPGLWKLEGKPEPVVALSPVDPPKPDEFKLPEIVDASKPVTPVITGPVTVAAPKAKSDIVLHEGDKPYEGDVKHGNKTRLVGVIKYEGTKVPRRPIDMSSDPFCKNAHDEDPLTDNMVVNADGTMQLTFVRIKSVPGKFDVPKEPVVLDQKGCLYYPHVAGVMAGQAFIVQNSDATLHNVHLLPKNNPELNVGQPAKGMREVITFKNAEENLFIKCDVHAWMNARVHVMPHPFFYVSDVEGRYEIRGLPPGKYTLEVIHELPKTPRMSVDVEVKADTSTRVDVTVK